ncbi:hypothetical protein PoB_002356100 [Plakobranchus ocellatus]|uniref:Uncharacterized protein n=1 Tax=Plakobranchus ocellatus TaxID=259542 RepID=A0AAV3ZCU5_9GAST|nr:hypothetical protein PoB_002356100 [Plakobranchus ocellatus]
MAQRCEVEKREGVVGIEVKPNSCILQEFVTTHPSVPQLQASRRIQGRMPSNQFEFAAKLQRCHHPWHIIRESCT